MAMGHSIFIASAQKSALQHEGEKPMKRFAVLAASGIGFVMVASAAHAQVTPIAYFDAPYPNNVPPSYAYANYAAWADSSPTTDITSNPTNWEVASTAGYGSNFFNIYFAPYGPTVNISNDNTLLLQVNVVSGTAGFLVDLYDGEGGGWQYQLGYGFGPGTYNLTVPLDAPSALDAYEAPNLSNPSQIQYTFAGPLSSGLDLSQIISYHLELDPGASASGGPNPYDVQFLNLAAVPEPASLGMGAVACMLFGFRRRR
jgi:hypothetical protein